MDESLFGHRDNAQIWILGIIDTSSKEFRIEGSISRNSETLKKFINKIVKSGNTIISDHWVGYDFLDRMDSGYTHIKFNHGMGQFWFSLTSTSHIEAIWGVLKQKIKSAYNVIPSKNIIHFIKEDEYKYNIRDKDFEVKIKDFFECFKLLENVSDTIIPKTEFLM